MGNDARSYIFKYNGKKDKWYKFIWSTVDSCQFPCFVEERARSRRILRHEFDQSESRASNYQRVRFDDQFIVLYLFYSQQFFKVDSWTIVCLIRLRLRLIVLRIHEALILLLVLRACYLIWKVVTVNDATEAVAKKHKSQVGSGDFDCAIVLHIALSLS